MEPARKRLLGRGTTPHIWVKGGSTPKQVFFNDLNAKFDEIIGILGRIEARGQEFTLRVQPGDTTSNDALEEIPSDFKFLFNEYLDGYEFFSENDKNMINYYLSLGQVDILVLAKLKELPELINRYFEPIDKLELRFRNNGGFGLDRIAVYIYTGLPRDEARKQLGVFLDRVVVDNINTIGKHFVFRIGSGGV